MTNKYFEPASSPCGDGNVNVSVSMCMIRRLYYEMCSEKENINFTHLSLRQYYLLMIVFTINYAACVSSDYESETMITVMTMMAMMIDNYDELEEEEEEEFVFPFVCFFPLFPSTHCHITQISCLLHVVLCLVYLKKTDSCT